MATITVSLAPNVAVHRGAATEAGRVTLRTSATSGSYDLGSVPEELLPWVVELAEGLPAESVTESLPDSLWPHAYALLERLNGVRALATSVRGEDSETPVVTFAPDRFATRPGWSPPTFAAGDLTISPRVVLHFEGGRWVAEHPGVGARVEFDDSTYVRLLTDIAQASSDDYDDAERAVVTALIDNALIVRAAADATRSATDDLWEFHDYYFHHRSRPGRHLAVSGGSYRFLDDFAPPPVVKPPMSSDRIALATGSQLTMPYGQVRDQRRSVRHGEGPLTVAQLGAFLGHVARLRELADSTHDAVSRRSYPGGGARYELEIYPLVHDVDGLAPGAYHYDPGEHVLERLSGTTPAVAASLSFAGRVATRKSPPRVLFVITARFGRVAWKYQSIAYSLVLKHVGVLYAVMYDTATAMNLSPCALGAGNVDFHAQATHTDPLAEPAVGEFILGGAPPSG
jgi:SagB-type dehydrogenase family enzyme